MAMINNDIIKVTKSSKTNDKGETTYNINFDCFEFHHHACGLTKKERDKRYDFLMGCLETIEINKDKIIQNYIKN